MDIAKLKPSERVVEIKSPKDNETPLGIRVTLVSISDPKLKGLKRRIQDARLKLEAKGKNFKAEQIDENRKELAFNAMTGWDWYGDVDFRGKKPDFNQATVFAVFDEADWFLRQIETEISEEQSFFGN